MALLRCWLLGWLALWGSAAGVLAQELDARTLFERRVRPILRSDAPSSCTACHLSGVELRDYLREDPAETFALLRAAGWINVERPDDSKLLAMIARTPPRPDPKLQRVQAEELAALRDWLRAAVRDPSLLRAQANGSLGTELPVEVIRHARSDRVLQSFVDNIWSEMGRCINCHSPERNRGKIKDLGQEALDAISWIVPNDPAATLQRLVDDGNIDLDHPELSPVLTKPAGLVKHGGGPKFLRGDPAYRKFLSFLTDYAAIRRGDYRTAEQLPPTPAELILLTGQHLRITGFPADWKELPWQVDLYAWDHAARTWSVHRVGTVFGRINPQGTGQHMVSVVFPSEAPPPDQVRRDPHLPHGPWLARLYVDRERKTDQDSAYRLGEAEFVGQAEIRGDWPPGYQPPKIIEFARFHQR